jgi:hypothetical protein
VFYIVVAAIVVVIAFIAAMAIIGQKRKRK